MLTSFEYSFRKQHLKTPLDSHEEQQPRCCLEDILYRKNSALLPDDGWIVLVYNAEIHLAYHVIVSISFLTSLYKTLYPLYIAHCLMRAAFP